MGIGKRAVNKQAARAKSFGRKGSGSAKDAEAYAQSKRNPRKTLAQRQAAHRRGS